MTLNVTISWRAIFSQLAIFHQLFDNLWLWRIAEPKLNGLLKKPISGWDGLEGQGQSDVCKDQ